MRDDWVRRSEQMRDKAKQFASDAWRKDNTTPPTDRSPHGARFGCMAAPGCLCFVVSISGFIWGFTGRSVGQISADGVMLSSLIFFLLAFGIFIVAGFVTAGIGAAEKLAAPQPGKSSGESLLGRMDEGIGKMEQFKSAFEPLLERWGRLRKESEQPEPPPAQPNPPASEPNSQPAPKSEDDIKIEAAAERDRKDIQYKIRLQAFRSARSQAELIRVKKAYMADLRKERDAGIWSPTEYDLVADQVENDFLSELKRLQTNTKISEDD